MHFFRDNKIALISIILGFVAVVFGVYCGEITTVLNKAIIICLECIGIG